MLLTNGSAQLSGCAAFAMSHMHRQTPLVYVRDGTPASRAVFLPRSRDLLGRRLDWLLYKLFYEVKFHQMQCSRLMLHSSTCATCSPKILEACAVDTQLWCIADAGSLTCSC